MASPLPVRLNDSTISRIDAVALRVGLNRSDIIRLCLNRFLDDFDARPDELLNRDWSGILDQFDGRKSRYVQPSTEQPKSELLPVPPARKRAKKP